MLALALALVAAGALGLPAVASAQAEDELAQRYAPVVRLVEQREECGPGEPYQPIDIDAILNEDTVSLRGPWRSNDLVTIAFLSQWGPIHVTGDDAQARSYVREIARMEDGSLFKVVGTYDDAMVRRAGEWQFLRRIYRPMIFEAPGDADSEHPYAPPDR